MFLFINPPRSKAKSSRTALRRCRLCCQPVAGFEALCPRCAKRAAAAPGFRFLPLAKMGGAK